MKSRLVDKLSVRRPLRAFRDAFDRALDRESRLAGGSRENGISRPADPAEWNSQQRQWLSEDQSLCEICRAIDLRALQTERGFQHRRVRHFHDEFYLKQGPYSGPREWGMEEYPIKLIYEVSRLEIVRGND